jgi:hypothetical protein
MTENVEVVVVGAKLEEGVFWTVPLVDYLFYEIFAITQSKANWPFVGLAARVAVNVHLHFIIVAQKRFGPLPPSWTTVISARGH